MLTKKAKYVFRNFRYWLTFRYNIFDAIIHSSQMKKKCLPIFVYLFENFANIYVYIISTFSAVAQLPLPIHQLVCSEDWGSP